jgi:hypothetical protein
MLRAVSGVIFFGPVFAVRCDAMDSVGVDGLSIAIWAESLREGAAGVSLGTRCITMTAGVVFAPAPAVDALAEVARFGADGIVVAPLPLAPAIVCGAVAGELGDAIDLGDPEAVFAGFGLAGAGPLAARS